MIEKSNMRIMEKNINKTKEDFSLGLRFQIKLKHNATNTISKRL